MVELDFKIIYSTRRTVALQISLEGELVVRAPTRTPLLFIQALLKQKSSWIAKHVGRRQAYSKPHQFIEDEQFLLRGVSYPLRIIQAYRSRLYFDGAFFLSVHKLSHAKRLFEDFYKTNAKDVFKERTEFCSRTMSIPYKSLAIRTAGTRWGSCSSLGNLNFNWKLVMAPPMILEYVVIHELAHIIHHNHSPDFWQLVERYYPEYKKARAWLRQQGNRLKV